MASKTLALVLGIRPDVIRASRIISLLDACPEVDLKLVWSGQHYSDNMKDVFFRELGIRAPDVELSARGATDAELVGHVIQALYPVLDAMRPAATMFLGDTNTVAGCVASAQLNIPIVHIEGCMRSYDWTMPEEKYRTLIDHLSDVIYAYLPSYKDNGVAEGLCPDRIVVTGNPIVDVLEQHFVRRRDPRLSAEVLGRYSVTPGRYHVMTSHRRENIDRPEPLANIMRLAAGMDLPVLFFAGYRTQRRLSDYGMAVPSNVRTADPIGYNDLLYLIDASAGVLTDSGTIVEEACVLGVPSVQMRLSTERPEVYQVGASIQFNPRGEIGPDHVRRCGNWLAAVRRGTWRNPFGDGRASERIVDDIVERVRSTASVDTHHPRFAFGRVDRAFGAAARQ